MGAPLTIGFLGRWRMIEAAVGVGWWWAACAAIAASLAGVFYGGRLIERVYFRRASTSVESAPRWGFAFAPALLAAILATAWGVEPSVLLHAAGAAASLMVGLAP
jgi:NADH:ubiquinone oxidoreductase subunit 2 (subunit N)